MKDGKKETVGKIATDLAAQDIHPQSAIELEREIHKEYEKNLLECIERGKKEYQADFFIVVITKKNAYCLMYYVTIIFHVLHAQPQNMIRLFINIIGLMMLTSFSGLYLTKILATISVIMHCMCKNLSEIYSSLY